jgi:hypothetical protein
VEYTGKLKKPWGKVSKIVMYQSQTGSVEPLAEYRIDPNPMRYNQFVRRL